jgi:hypothetical protein
VTTVLEAQAELARQEAAAKGTKRPSTKARSKASAETLVLPPEKKKRSAIPLVAAIVLIGGAAAAYFALTGEEKPQGDGGNTRAADVGNSTPTTTPQPPVLPPVDPVSPPVDPIPPPVDPVPPPVDPVPPPVDPVPPPVDPVPPPVDPASTPPTDPVTPPPGPGPDVPTPPPSGVAPEDCCARALPLAAAGNWSGARALYKQAVAASEITSPTQVAALRGTAESYIAEADALARSDRVPDALALLGEAARWLDEQHEAYESVKNAVEVARLQLGFSRMHLAEAHAESARWLMLQGDGQAADAELAKAASNYDFARQQLERDGVRFWEFLIRRAEFHRLRGDSENMIADVAHTTKTNNHEVPAHMWVAHATAARRLAQAQADGGDGARGLEWVRKAMKVAEDGASWQEDKLNRQQWLDLARVLFVGAAMLPAGEDPTSVHGKLRYWVEMAGKQPPAASLHADAAKAGLTTGRAMERLLHGMVMRFREQEEAATGAFEDAASLTAAAIALRKGVAAQGGLLEDRLAYEVQAAVMRALGRSDATQAAVAAARTVEQKNPD